MLNQCILIVLLLSILSSFQLVTADHADLETLTFLDVETLFDEQGTSQLIRLRELIADSLNNAQNDGDDLIIERVVDMGCSSDMDHESVAQAFHEAAVIEALHYAASLPDSDTTTTITTYTYMPPMNNNRILLFGALITWALIGLVAIIWIVVDALKPDEDQSSPTVSINAPSLRIQLSTHSQQPTQSQLREPLLNDVGIMV